MESNHLLVAKMSCYLWCSFMMEYDIHTVLDFLTLGATLWVMYTLRMPLKDTYQAEQDSVQSYYVVSHPCNLEPSKCRAESAFFPCVSRVLIIFFAKAALPSGGRIWAWFLMKSK